jgi:hypothetical protein
MSTPQDAPTRKKQKARAAKKLEAWKKKTGDKTPAEKKK